MAKSMRSKVKRSFRSKKREDSVYAATEAARLHRLNAKLKAVVEKDTDGDVPLEDVQGEGASADDEEPLANNADTMVVDIKVDNVNKSTRISTHGSRGSRREEWRKSKGMVPRPKRAGMNRQGGVAALSKAGRSHRRR